MTQMQRTGMTVAVLGIGLIVWGSAGIASAQGPAPSARAVAASAGTRGDVLEPVSPLAGKLEVGTRLTTFELTEDSGDFYGSIDTLKADQNYAPIKVFACYKPVPCLGLGLAYETLRAETWTENKAGEAPYTDGTIDLRGPIFSVRGLYPNSTIFLPYAELGLAWYMADFEETTEWATRSGQYDNYQSFEFSDATALILDVGCGIQIHRQWEADVMVRYTDVEVDGAHMILGNENQANGRTPDFSLANYALGLGVKYCF